MDTQIMSSEESDVNEDNEVIVVKPLPWRSEQVNDFLKRLDDRITKDRSPQAQRQAKKRVPSSVASLRLKPGSSHYPAWLFKN